ncbi:MAG: (2Fe-2S)-binding protein [Xanthobacteraceae bacterium]|nr:(2Fe-2S)-binding protein [Xanthobacteraceae bacterium]
MTDTLDFLVNGRSVSVACDGTVPLLTVLRDHLGLRGTKFGCGTEQCGACMVLIDGKPEYSCSREAATVADKAIVTVEGLWNGEELSALQQAFLDEQAGQCGYCLSGILVSAMALLDKNKNPSRADIIAALDPHLCRCGIQNRVVRAVQKAGAALGGARS